MINKLFSKSKSNNHIIYKILGIKISFIDKSLNKVLGKYLYAIDEREKYDYLNGGGEFQPANVNINNQIWTCWLQGEDNEPEIVNFCINRIKKYYPDTIVITEDNINDYIILPDFIWDKYKKGIITRTHFSDIIRVCLLDKYGGIWIDSTCYLTQYIPEFILKQECFFFEWTGEKNISSWFIKSVQNNYIIKSIKTFLFEYWIDNNTLIEYFLFHKFVDLARVKHDNFKTYWNKTIKICLYANVCFLFMTKFVKDYNFDKDYFNWLCAHSFIHKLSYKIDTNSHNFKNEQELTYCLQFLKEYDLKCKK